MKKTRRIFIGNSVTDNQPKAKFIDFSDFVQASSNFEPRHLKPTVDVFKGMKKDKQGALKNFKYVLPCELVPNGLRKRADCKTVSMLCIDVDYGEDAEKILDKNADYGRLTKTANAVLAPFKFWIYTSFSHLIIPGAARCRLFIEVEKVPVNRYPDAVSTICAALGIKPNKETLNPVQLMFLPGRFLSGTYENFRSIKRISDTRRGFRVSDINKAFIGEKPEEADEGLDIFSIWDPPIDLELEEAKAVLKYINPDDPYDLGAGFRRDGWLKVGMALKHQFGDAGFPLFEAWSSTADNYVDDHDCMKAYQSFKSVEELGRQQITMRSLVKIAKENGYIPGEGKQISSLESRVRFELDKMASATDIKEILAYGKKAAAITDQPWAKPLIAERMYTRHLEIEPEKPLKIDAFKMIISQEQEKRKQLDDQESLRLERERIARESIGESYSIYQDQSGILHDCTSKMGWSKDWIYIKNEQAVWRPGEAEPLTKDNFNNVFTSTSTQKELDGKSPWSFLQINNLWKVVDYRGYLPGSARIYRDDQFTGSMGSVDGHGGAVYLNTWRDTGAKPHRGKEFESDCDAIIEHLQNLWPQDWQIIADWMAYTVQQQSERIDWALVLSGGMGVGKSLLSELLTAALGASNVKQITPDDVSGTFTSWAFGAKLGVMEELMLDKSRKLSVMNKLKPYITNSRINVQEKFVKSFNTRNVTNYMAMTNFNDVLVIKEGERRWCVCLAEFATKREMQDFLGGEEETLKYFSTLFNIARNRPGHARAFFEDYKISDNFNPHVMPIPSTHHQMIEISLSKNDLYMQRVLRAKVPYVTENVVSATVLQEILDGQFDFEIDLGNYDVFGKPASVLNNMGYRRFPTMIRLEPKGGYPSKPHSLWYKSHVLAGIENAKKIDKLKKVLYSSH